jgi:hypothetical protein
MGRSAPRERLFAAPAEAPATAPLRAAAAGAEWPEPAAASALCVWTSSPSSEGWLRTHSPTTRATRATIAPRMTQLVRHPGAPQRPITSGTSSPLSTMAGPAADHEDAGRPAPQAGGRTSAE